MDIVLKIAKSEIEFLEKIQREVRRRYSKVYGYTNITHKMFNDVLNHFKLHLSADGEQESYNYLMRGYRPHTEKVYGLLSIELKRLLSSRIITQQECTRIRKLAKGNTSSQDLAKVIINNYRNKRIRKERLKNARKAKL